MSSFDNIYKSNEGSRAAEPRLNIPANIAHNYVTDMLSELTQIAKDAKLTDLTALLEITVAAAKINGRHL